MASPIPCFLPSTIFPHRTKVRGSILVRVYIQYIVYTRTLLKMQILYSREVGGAMFEISGSGK